MPSPPESDSQEPTTDPPVLAFAQGTGVVLQTVGILLFFASCCSCFMTGGPLLSKGEVHQRINQAQQSQRTADKPDTPAVESPDQPTLSDWIHDPAKIGMMLMVSFTTLGGVAMAAFGLGMQSDKPRAALGATFTTAGLLLILVISAGCLWFGGATITEHWGAKLWNGILLLLIGTLLGFCVASLRLTLKHPPSGEPNLLPPDYEPPKSRH